MYNFLTHECSILCCNEGTMGDRSKTFFYLFGQTERSDLTDRVVCLLVDRASRALKKIT